MTVRELRTLLFELRYSDQETKVQFTHTCPNGDVEIYHLTGEYDRWPGRTNLHLTHVATDPA